VSWLIQDEITLIPDSLTFLAGTKMEVNPFTGFEIQPSGRLLKTIDDRRVVWGAVSRAIRRPNRLDENLDIQVITPNPNNPGTISITGSPNIKSDVLVAFETGYRAQPIDPVSWDVTCFCNFYDGLPVYDNVPQGGLGLDVAIENGANAQTYGAELSSTIELTETWKVTGAYTYLQIFTDIYGYDTPFGGNTTRKFYEDNSPSNLVYLRNSWSPNARWDFDVIHRYVDEVAFGSNPAYVEMDLRAAWRPRERLELAIVGQNLLDSAHAEFGTREVVPFNAVRTQVQRGVHGSISYEF
jgi:iron complex outermembrane receptor protein